MKLLNHRYPRVRVYTAEQLYIKLLEDEGCIADSCSNFEGAMVLLLEVDWGGSNTRQERNKVADFLSIKLSSKVREGFRGPNEKRNRHLIKDEFESYLSLVKDSGR